MYICIHMCIQIHVYDQYVHIYIYSNITQTHTHIYIYMQTHIYNQSVYMRKWCYKILPPPMWMKARRN